MPAIKKIKINEEKEKLKNKIREILMQKSKIGKIAQDIYFLFLKEMENKKK